MKKIGILKDSELGKIAVLSPENINQLKEYATFFVETNMGEEAGFSDESYKNVGATILNTKEEIVKISDIIVSYNTILENEEIQSNKIYIGAQDVLGSPQILPAYLKKGIDLYSLNLLPRSTLAQNMDILSSVASILGYKSVLVAATISTITLPMITGAGGTLRPAQVLILGAGVAGLQAIATAKRLGAVVRSFDVRAAAKIDVKSLGAQFVEIPGADDNIAEGGYAVEQTADYLKTVNDILFEEAVKADIIICTAKIPGKQAPKLISKEAVLAMKTGAVIIDLAAESGGNCEVTVSGKTFKTDNGITIMGELNILAKSSKSASFLLGNNFTKFLKYYFTNQENENDEILKATKIVSDGEIVHPRILSTFNK